MNPGDVLYELRLGNGEMTTTHVVSLNLAVGPAIHFTATQAKGWTTLLVAHECTENAPTKVRLYDSAGNEIWRIMTALLVLRLWRNLGKSVVVACGAGRSRAASLAAAHLVDIGRFAALEEAVASIKRHRPEANPNAGILADMATALFDLRKAGV